MIPDRLHGLLPEQAVDDALDERATEPRAHGQGEVQDEAKGRGRVDRPLAHGLHMLLVGDQIGEPELIAGLLTAGAGRPLPADLIVCATGYGSMNGWAADLISQDVADKVGKVWGLGSDTPKDPGPWEGEQRNMWKPTQQEALWFHGGNLHQSRHYSQFLSLQIKARMEGIDTPVYGLQERHHLS